MPDFGNWRVTTAGIEWIGNYNNPDYREPILIPLNEVHIRRTGNIYEWPIHVGNKDILREDMYAFNTAFIFAMELAGKDFTPEGSLSNTFIQQGNDYESNQEDQSDEISIGGRI